VIRIYHDWRELPAEARGATVALGNFDGVHRGHAEVIKAAHAARPKVPLGVLTFEPHPREHFRPDDPPFRLTLSAERAAALEGLGVTLLYELRVVCFCTGARTVAALPKILEGLASRLLGRVPAPRLAARDRECRRIHGGRSRRNEPETLRRAQAGRHSGDRRPRSPPAVRAPSLQSPLLPSAQR